MGIIPNYFICSCFFCHWTMFIFSTRQQEVALIKIMSSFLFLIIDCRFFFICLLASSNFLWLVIFLPIFFSWKKKVWLPRGKSFALFFFLIDFRFYFINSLKNCGASCSVALSLLAHCNTCESADFYCEMMDGRSLLGVVAAVLSIELMRFGFSLRDFQFFNIFFNISCR